MMAQPVRRSDPEEGVLPVAVVNEVPDEQGVRVDGVDLPVHLKQVSSEATKIQLLGLAPSSQRVAGTN